MKLVYVYAHVCVCPEMRFDMISTVCLRQKTFGKRCHNLALCHILLAFCVCKTN